MSVRCFLDTNIFLYAHDGSAVEKKRAARELISVSYSSGNCVISTQVMSEFFQNYVVKFNQPYSDALKELHFMSQCSVVEQTLSLLLEGARLFNQYSLSWWDSLIIAAAVESEAEILYSEDLQHNQTIGMIKIINPFLQAPKLIS